MASESLVGRQIGPYQITEQIGQGGMAQVFKAYHAALERIVAVKVMHPFLAADPDFFARFSREARAMAALEHPNILPVYDFNQIDNTYYIVMRYVEGGTLKERLAELAAEGKMLPFAEAVRITEQIASALAHAHGRGLVHRDVKPANVMMGQNGAQLTDFGIARLVQQDALTATGALIGTPSYMAPEQAQGFDMDGRSDLYALAIMFFEMVTGRVPYNADTLAAVMMKQIMEPVPDVRALNPNLPPAATAFFQKALAKDPNGRFQTAEEFAAAVRALAGEAGGNVTETVPRPTVDAEPWVDPTSSETITLSPPVAVTMQRDSAGRSLQMVAVVALLIFLIAFVLGLLRVVPQIWGTVLGGGAVLIAVLWAGLSWLGRERSQPSTFTYTSPPPPPRVERTTPIPEVDDLGMTFVPSRREPMPEPVGSSATELALQSSHRMWMRSADNYVIEDLILQKDFERLKSFITDFEGGRFLLTGYGRFGGTSLVKGAMEKARRELQQRADGGQAALLVFYFNVRETAGDQPQGRHFSIEANEFSLKQLQSVAATIAPPGQKRGTGDALATQLFSLAQPLGASFLNRSGLTQIIAPAPSAADPVVNLSDVADDLNRYAAAGKQNDALRDLVLQLTQNEAVASKVVIILDRIESLETLEGLAQMRLFRNPAITAIAVARQEDVDRWEDVSQRLSKIRFRKWYVPCLWQSGTDHMEQIEQTLLRSYEAHGIDAAETAVQAENFRKHLEFRGRGALGHILEELKDQRNWIKKGRQYVLRLDEMPDPSTMQHNAWRQRLLDLNWDVILSDLFVGNEEEDRARIGIYYLLDWVWETKIFDAQQLQSASRTRPIQISHHDRVVNEVVLNLLGVLEHNGYLSLTHGTEYRLSWKRENHSEPRRVSLQVAAAAPPPNAARNPLPDQSELLHMLDTYFSEKDLRDLVFHLRLDYDNLEGGDKASKARELILHCQRNNRQDELLRRMRKMRPHLFPTEPVDR